MKKGFTIVELMMVIGIIAVLMGIVTTAASSSVKMSRKHRADALCTLVQTGLATYYAQKSAWPIGFSSGSNSEDADGHSDPDTYELSGGDVRACVLALVNEAKAGNPVMDISGLWVSRSTGEMSGDKVNRGMVGMDFMSAVRGTKQSKKKMKTSEMYFGYPDPETGAFLRFKMVYSRAADSITVSKQR